VGPVQTVTTTPASRRWGQLRPSQRGHFNLSQSVERHIADLHNHLAALAQKIDLYESLLDEHDETDTM